MRLHGPERLAGQGLNPAQFESGDRAILSLLTDPVVSEQVDLVLTWRSGDDGDTATGAYEVWSTRGMVRFQRLIDGKGNLHFEVLEVVGINPLEAIDPLALATVEAESAAAAASGFDPHDPARRFIAPEQQSYPFAFERVAQLFDSPNAPDLAVSPRDWCAGHQPGQHGALHVRQARAPLWFSGPGVKVGRHALAARSVDIAPTVLAALGTLFLGVLVVRQVRSMPRGTIPSFRQISCLLAGALFINLHSPCWRPNSSSAVLPTSMAIS